MSNYQKKFWKRGEGGMTPILAGDLNKYEDYLFMHDQQIENLTHIPEGSTTADLEVIDGRVGYDGEIFNSLGDAIRGQIEDVYDRMGHPIYPKGTISFENLPNFDIVTVGDMYNISNDFTTDSRFAEGSGKKISAGANVYAIDTNGTMQWDLFAPVNNVVIDSALSDTSENPVQNKVVTGNVKDLKAHTRTNLLNPTAQTQTKNGVTFTNNGDGTYTVNGTATTQAYIILTLRLDLTLFRGKNIKLAGCPSGGGADKYQFNINIYDAQGTLLGGRLDYGEGFVSPVPNNASYCNVVIAVQRGTTVNNLLFKPMLTTDLNAKYDDYVPYTGFSGKLNKDVAEIRKVSDETYTNLINPTAQTQTVSGVTITNNGDGTYLINGTYTGSDSNWRTLCVFTFEKNMKCKLTGTPPTSTLGQAGCLRLEKVGGGGIVALDTGKGAEFNAYSESDYALYLQIYRGTTFNNLLFKPMITTKLDATYDDYIPYSGSGALNENVQELYDMNNANTTALNGKADSFSSLTTYYNANTGHTVVDNRKSAITYVYNTYILNGKRSTYNIRYLDGFYAAVTFCGSTYTPQCIETIFQGVGGTHHINVWELINDVWTLYASIQTKSDKNLTTTSKQIVGAINELDSELTDIIQVKNIYKNGVTLTANGETMVDFTSEIASATPNGYKFIGMSFCGAYPHTTWQNMSVTPSALNPSDKSLKFTTTQTQPYNLCMMGTFIRNI